MLKVAMHEPAVPILLSNDATYTQLRHYGPPELVRPARHRHATARTWPCHGLKTVRNGRCERSTAGGRSRWEEYDAVKQRAGTFFVYGDARWLILQLIHDGARVELVGEGFGQQLLRVTLPGQAGRS
jgi:hypothetical protein